MALSHWPSAKKVGFSSLRPSGYYAYHIKEFCILSMQCTRVYMDDPYYKYQLFR
jgi:hypothetical protein